MGTLPPPDDRSDAGRHSPRFITGRLVAGRYEILNRIGEGGAAEVFQARDHRLDRIVAVKVLRPQYGHDPDARARFAVEARSAAALAVSNIVPVYDFGAAEDGSLFIVMRFIDGPSLRRVLSERGSLSSVEAIEVGRQVAQALAAAHGHGLVHRDVKPGNILLDRGGTAHLTDFGVVKALAGGNDLTRTGMIFGTAAYLSPEQATGGPLGPRTDLYSLGVVLYEALAGRPLFSGDDPVAVSYQHAHASPTPLADLVPGVDPELARVVMQCLEKDPQQRPASAEDVAATLASIGGRLGSTLPAVAMLGGLAAAVGAASGRPGYAADPGLELGDLDNETVRMPVLHTGLATASSVSTARADGWSPRSAPSNPYAGPAHAHHVQPGIIRPTRASRAKRGARKAGGAAVVLLAIALLLFGAVALPGFMPSRDRGAVGDAPETSPGRTPRLTLPQVVAPTPTAAAADLPSALPVPSVPSVTPAAPSPTVPPATLEPAPEPTVRQRPERTPKPTPRPTPKPTPEPDPTPPPAPQELSVRIPDGSFVGDYPGDGRYHGRSASWVYGQGTPYHTMTARFRLTHDGQVGRRASLQFVGLDGENPRKNRMSVVLNGVTIYEGPSPFPNDFCCGGSGPGNWGSAVFEFPGELLRRNNSLVVSNLEPSDCTTCPAYVMVDFAVLEYRVRP